MPGESASAPASGGGDERPVVLELVGAFRKAMTTQEQCWNALSLPLSLPSMTSNDTSSEQYCSSCCAQLPAVGHCVDCDRCGGYGLLCANCLSAHRFMHLLRAHQVNPINGSRNGSNDSTGGDCSPVTNGAEHFHQDCKDPAVALLRQLADQLSTLTGLISDLDRFEPPEEQGDRPTRIKKLLVHSSLIAETLLAKITDSLVGPNASNGRRDDQGKRCPQDSRPAEGNRCKQSVDELLTIINDRFALTNRPPKISISSEGQIYLDNEKTPYTVCGVPQNSFQRRCRRGNLPLRRSPPDPSPTTTTDGQSSSENLTPPVRFNCRMGPLHIRQKFGFLGPARGQFNSPHGFALGPDGEIIIADTNNHRVQVFDGEGEFKYQFGVPGRDEGQLWYPRKVAVIPRSGRFVVCDRGNERSRMQVFSRGGHFIKKISIRYIDIVAGLAVNQQGHIVAVDSVSPTAFLISEGGELLRWFDCSNDMREPSDIAIDGHEYYICDFKGHCVAVFHEDGMFLRRIGCENVTNFPNGIDIDSSGRILVGDSHGNRFHVAVFNREGLLLTELECPYVKVSRCCGLKAFENGDRHTLVTLAKNNHHVLILGLAEGLRSFE